MKTNTNQVRSHRSAARPAPQVKTARNHKPQSKGRRARRCAAEPLPPARQVELIVFASECVFDAGPEVPGIMARFKVTEDTFNLARAAALSAGIPLGAFVQEALQEKSVWTPGRYNGDDENTVSVILFNHATDATVSPGIDLDAAEFAAIQKDAAARGETIDDWLQRTFEDTPALRGDGSAANSLLAQARAHLRGLESTIHAAASLLTLLGREVQDRGLMILAADLALQLKVEHETAIESSYQPAALPQGGAR
jgi:hypothetical protein